ncbi:aldo/keto reductase [Halorubrum ezzemoulense]|uniref:General stress protein n=1 Tax=Halorubrum ezzemoulense TaxID=337243 RepID=A0A256J5J5_HALEZ|nr:aldo/keto reductase [Halorubrum ezzemoulense]MDB2264014.1 aldo/keto reductase [Halorubrum ezzemoulense]MDB9234531.1 aldo/keto reductase [Halorubrum ezzemoulense]MDB9279854.1 aldo/keto reductase [Halorubrum ezzemoulense]MDB9283191.1 aldo/keto reductase [Halorubrum ezzemoulense]OYR64071.1 general stress protein [Halorubrum ezzemoulense]
MQHRELGNSGVEVSEVGFGAWVVGTDWWGDRSDEQAVGMVEEALDAGVTYVDTGDVYGHGDSEEIIGTAIAGRRDEVTLSTKIGYDFYDNPQAGHGELPKELNREYLTEAFEASLDRLDTDYVDVLQLHNANVDEVTPEVRDLLREWKADGRVRALGWALGPSIGWLAEGDAAVEYEEFDAVQTVFNLFEQEPGRHFVDTIRESGSDTSVIARVPHSSGLLNEQVTPDTVLEDGDHRSHRPKEWYETGWEKVDAIRFLEDPDGVEGARTMAQAAIRWLLAHDEVASVTPTFRDGADIAEWSAAADVPPISDAEYERLDDLYARNFDIDRDDGMDVLRTSVDGEDIEAAGLDKRAASY